MLDLDQQPRPPINILRWLFPAIPDLISIQQERYTVNVQNPDKSGFWKLPNGKFH